MTTAADDSAVEDAFEAILAGRPVPERAAGLAAFTGAVRASATTPGRPNAALAELLATGLLTDQSSPSVRTARSAGSAPERRSRVRTRRRSAMILPALIAKFLSAGAVAQAATGAAVVVVAVTGAGAAGALPARVQDTFATVVAEITPLEPPTSEETTGESTEEVVPEETVTEGGETTNETTEVVEVVDDAAATEAYVTEWALDGPAGSASFTAWVEEGNADGRVKEWLRANGMTFGNVVSAWASGKGFSEEELAILGADAEEPVEAPTEQESDQQSTDVSETEGDQAGTAVADSGSRGNGNGKGTNGNGTNGNGTNGNGNGRGNGKN